MRPYPFQTPALLKMLYPNLAWHGEREKVLYLTFDDGPIPEVTPYVVAKLGEYDAKGTFFCVGHNLKKYPEILRLIIQKGHSVGNHTYNHLDGWRTSNKEYFANTIKCEEQLVKLVPNRAFKLFRPPYGKIRRSQIKRLTNDYKIVMWDYLTGDFDVGLTPEKCREKAVRAIKPGAIVILHDSQKAFPRMKVTLEAILECFSQKGFQFKSLDDFNFEKV